MQANTQEASTYRYVVTGATVLDDQDKPVGAITFVNQPGGGQYRWQMGMMNRFPTPSVEAQGFCRTYDEAKAALDGALKDRRPTG